MLETTTDFFMAVSVLSTLLTGFAILGGSQFLGIFSGLLFVFAGIYGLTSNITFGFMSSPIAFAMIGIGLYLMYEGAFIGRK